MTQYLIAVNHTTDEAASLESMDPAQMQGMFEAVEAFNERLRTEGAWVFAGGLEPVEATTTVDNTGAEPIITDGPFAESKEYLGGFWVIEAADLDAALKWAADGSKACAGRVEVRPFQSE